MNEINFPLHISSSGKQVNDLHVALSALIPVSGIAGLVSFFNDAAFQASFRKEVKLKKFGTATQSLITVIQEQALAIKGTGEVDERTAGLLNIAIKQNGAGEKVPVAPVVFKIEGTVRDTYQEPVVDVFVAAFDKNIRSNMLLNKAKTDSSGYYTIIYDRRALQEAGKEQADVFIEATDKAGKVVYTSAVVYNAPAELMMNVNLSGTPYPGPSLFEQVGATIISNAGGVPVENMEEDSENTDISYLAAKTGLDTDLLTDFIFSAQYNRQTGIPAEVFFGILQKGLPGDMFNQTNINTQPNSTAQSSATLNALRQEPLPKLQNALQNAVSANIIPLRINRKIKEITRQLQEFVRAAPEQQPTVNPGNLISKANLASLTTQQSDILNTLLNTSVNNETDLWQAIDASSDFDAPAKSSLKATLSLSSLTQNNLGLTKAILKKENVKSESDLRKLGEMDEAGWQKYLADLDPDKSEPLTPGLAKKLTSAFGKAYPTAAFKGALKRSEQADLPLNKKTADFLDAHPDFDLSKSPVHKFTGPDEKDLAGHLLELQRLHKIAPNFNAVQALSANGLHSAKQVYFTGKSNFIKQYSGTLGKDQAGKIFRNAKQHYAASLNFAMQMKSTAQASAIKSFPDYSGIMKITPGFADQFPNLQNLLLDTDTCACDDCSSVYGAAAYLTDILQFLSYRMSVNPPVTTRDVFLQRRPEIGDIDLNCDNTNTLVPYIDIVNELLEDFISPAVFTINVTFLADIAAGTINNTLFEELVLNAGNVAISDIADLSAAAIVSDSYSITANLTEWIIRDSFITLKLSYQQGSATISVKLLRQSLLTGDQISAHPEYTNAAVYTSQYLLNTSLQYLPFSLPYDFAAAESDLYLQKMGINKYDLIKAFSKPHEIPSAPGNLYTDTQYNYAYAYLGINHAEQSIILVADATANQANYWPGYNTANYPVSTFLAFTGIQYSDLLTLLTLQAINPLSDSFIVSTIDPTTQTVTCDITEKSISNLSNAKFDAIRRFLRLWTKSGMAMQDLDSCIMSTVLGNGVIDNNFAVALQNFLQLQNTFSLTTAQLLSFYQDIDTSTPDSLYFQLFQNRSNALNPDFSIANAASAPPSPMSLQDSLLITGALGISSSDLELLVARSNAPATLLSAVSFYNRYALLAQSLSLSVTDLLSAIDLIVQYPAYQQAVDPFAGPVNTGAFMTQFNLLAISGFSIADLNYLLFQQDPGNSYIPDDNTISVNLAAIGSGLLSIIGKTTAPAPQTIQPTNANTILSALNTLLTTWLADPVLNWDQGIAKKVLDILNITDDPIYPAAGATAPFYPLFDAALLQYADFLSALCITYPVQSFSVGLSVLPDGLDFGPYSAQASYNPDTFLLVFAGNMSPAIYAGLLLLSPDGGYKAAIDQLYSASVLAQSTLSNNLLFPGGNAAIILNEMDVQARCLFFFNALATVYQQNKVLAFIQNQLTTAFKVDKSISAQLMTSLPGIITDLSAPALVNAVGAVTAAAFPQQFSRYLQLSKIAFAVNKLVISATGLAWLLADAATVNVLDLQSLPLTPVTLPLAVPPPANAAITFESWARLINLFKLAHYYPVVNFVNPDATITPISIFSVLNDFITADGDGITNLLILTGWDTFDAEFLLNYTAAPVPDPYVNAPNPLLLNIPADLSDVDILLQLYVIFSISAMLSASIDNCVTWTSDQLAIADAENIIQAMKSQYQDADWLGVTQPLQDQLRQQKRDALVNYILATNTEQWVSSDDLYNNFLIDVEMNAAQSTSRIVQATNSVQLFVQRCFMNLEEDVIVDAATDDSWPQWTWMQYYRLWEANREVFVYPENWIEPSLLPVQSPFFVNLQNALQQNSITNDNVESYYQDYLVSLDGVARLEIKGMWYQDDSDILHVFARTYGGDPRAFYYRTLQQNTSWTPWQNVNLDIKGDYIIPVVYNRRIYLFWPVFTMQQSVPTSFAVPSQSSSQGTFTPQQPDQQWTIQMAFSELKNGKWSPKVVSTDNIQVTVGSADTFQTQNTDKSNYLFIPLDFPDVCGLLQDLENKNGYADFLTDLVAALQTNSNLTIGCFQTDTNGNGDPTYEMLGAFTMDPCRGYPVLNNNVPDITPVITVFDQSYWVNQLDESNDDSEVLSVKNETILGSTIGTFNNLMPLQVGFFDKLFYIFLYADYWENNCAGSTFNTASLKRDEYRERIRISLGTFMSFFYQDDKRTYYVAPEIGDDNTFEFFYDDFEGLFVALFDKNWQEVKTYLEMFANVNPKLLKPLFHFYNFYHPLTCYYIRQLYANGIDGLLSRATQLTNDPSVDTNPKLFDFNATYQPSSLVFTGPAELANGKTINSGYPTDDTDFNFREGYANYNWELFFHIPLLIAESLSQNQQFDDATRWFNYIFNPTDTSSNPSPQKYWVTKPFFQTTDATYFQEFINNLMVLVNDDPIPGDYQNLLAEVANWRGNPFEPHDVAQFRTVAYQKTVVMKFVNHLITYGDYMFMQDTMESVNQATQLYVMASEILGPVPLQISSPFDLEYKTYNQLEAIGPDSFSNALVEIENLLPLQQVSGYDGTKPTDPQLPALETLYFCIPQNDQLLGYWDTIADRLFKIRNSLNIDGVFSPLALFAPPIDPGMLVNAVASGLDLSSILSDLNAPLPYYKFSVMIQKAVDLCNDVKALGNSLLSALEKKDSEGLALLRSQQEVAVQQAVLLVKQKQLDDANNSLAALQKTADLNQIKVTYYTNLISSGWNAAETTAIALNGTAIGLQVAGTVLDTLASVMHEIPDVQGGASGVGGSPHVTIKFGGQNIGDGVHAAAASIHGVAGSIQTAAGISSNVGSFQRRAQEWQQQLDLANKETEHINLQIAGAQIKIATSQQEVDNQNLQINNSQNVFAYMQSKYTNQDLYTWMISQISNVYFSSYNLAYRVAKSAEITYRYELAVNNSSYINFGYWDSLNKGLLSGDKLMADIKQLEIAYYDQNQREYELTKHISLALLNPTALLSLKENGKCFVDLQESLFDMDYPGQYLRRIKTVSVTIPCVAGPYITVACSLTMMKNSTRISNVSTGANTYSRKQVSGAPADDKRFKDSIGAVQTIVTSSAVNDGGLFEVSLRDERYLPFEGAGALSSWYIQLPSPLPQFDYQSISDLIIHLKYTSREGGDQLAFDAAASLQTQQKAPATSPLSAGFSAKRDFPTEWYKFLNTQNASGLQQLNLNIAGRFPYFTQAPDAVVQVNSVNVYANTGVTPLAMTVSSVKQTNVPANFKADTSLNNILIWSLNCNEVPGAWQFLYDPGQLALTSDNINDLIFVFGYSVKY